MTSAPQNPNSFTPPPSNDQWTAASQAAPAAGQFGTVSPQSSLGDDLGGSFSWMWKAFTRNLGVLIVPTLVWGFVILALTTIAIVVGVIALRNMEWMTDPYTGESYPTTGFGVGNLLIIVLLTLIIALVAAAWYSGIAKAIGMIARGETPTISQGFFSGRLMVVAIVVGIIVGIASLVPVLGTIAALFFLTYAVPAAAIDKLGLGAAIKASARAALDKPVLALLTIIIASVASNLLGALVLPIIVVYQLTLLLHSSNYLRSTGRVPAAQ
ncbi:MAG: hypothetical protein Q4G21_08350 [Dermabacter sp.]|nr:hypothetical protein [Dermabacter sp.]